MATREATLMSESNDLERLLKEAVLIHLSEEELGAYHENTVHEADRCRMQYGVSVCP